MMLFSSAHLFQYQYWQLNKMVEIIRTKMVNLLILLEGQPLTAEHSHILIQTKSAE
ncbi:hypothetical protein FLV_12065 [Flavobacterium pectinovorum]|nr:hypothetical protein [Flavobacterium pectinovorum]